MKKKKIIIEGMGCKYCASQVDIKLRKIDGINSVKLNFAENSAIVELLHELDNDKFKVAVEEAECKIVEIKDF